MKEYRIMPRYNKVEGNIQMFEMPKGMVVLRLERHAGDGTLTLVCERVSLAKKRSK